MRIFRLIAAAALLAAISVLPAFAQGTARPAVVPAGGASGVLPETKIGYINTEVFADEKQGITRFVVAMKSLEREFQPRQTELNQLQGRINQLADDIKKLGAAGPNSPVDPKVVQQKQDQGEALARELDFKKKEAEAAYQKKYTEVVTPISEDIGKALDVFAKQRGVTMLFDISKLAPAVLSINEGMDMTKAFIVEYNSRNPSTASR